MDGASSTPWTNNSLGEVAVTQDVVYAVTKALRCAVPLNRPSRSVGSPRIEDAIIQVFAMIHKERGPDSTLPEDGWQGLCVEAAHDTGAEEQ